MISYAEYKNLGGEKLTEENAETYLANVKKAFPNAYIVKTEE